jgi:ribose-phosphate pyrophosphokinase
MESMKDNLVIIALNSYAERAKSVENWIRRHRGDRKPNYIANISQIRFSNGEAKIKLNESIRGKDVYILADIGNYDVTYKMFGQLNRMSPDDHFQDIKRAISAANGKARRITVVMPMLYASRQHRRKGRESIDCAIALKELERMGVHGIVTFDVHDPNIINAIPLGNFDNVYPTHEILKLFIKNERKNINKENMYIVAPDPGAMERSVFYAGLLGLDVGLVYKRRDHSTIVNGKNPVVEFSYMGRDVEGKSILIIDDMIASGGTMLEVAAELKKRGAKDISLISTFSIFNDGIEEFDKLHAEGIIKKVYSTNLAYLREEVRNAEWFCEVDLMSFVGKVIDTLNKNESMSPLLSSQDKIQELLRKEDFK